LRAARSGVVLRPVAVQHVLRQHLPVRTGRPVQPVHHRGRAVRTGAVLVHRAGGRRADADGGQPDPPGLHRPRARPVRRRPHARRRRPGWARPRRARRRGRGRPVVTGLRLAGGSILSAAGDAATGDLAIRAGRIAESRPDDEIVDVTGHLVLPGLANRHDHLRSLLPASRAAETLPLPAVVERAGAAGAAATPEHYRALTALGAARMVLGGVTSVIDHIYPVHVPGMI